MTQLEAYFTLAPLFYNKGDYLGITSDDGMHELTLKPNDAGAVLTLHNLQHGSKGSVALRIQLPNPELAGKDYVQMNKMILDWLHFFTEAVHNSNPDSYWSRVCSGFKSIFEGAIGEIN